MFDSGNVSEEETHALPICLVDGFMSHKSFNIWKKFIDTTPSSKIFLRTSAGGAASAYDTAIKLFYEIKGGQVNYGERHSQLHHHHQLGPRYPGSYPIWNETHPIHFLCHSFGGNSVLLLQKLLDEDTFYDEKGKLIKTSSKWIKSITTISSPLRGSPLVYLLGYKAEAQELHPLSPGSLLYRFCYLWNFFTTESIRSLSFDFNMDQFDLFESSSLVRKLITLIYRFSTGFRFDYGKDNAATDISFDRLIKNKVFDTQPHIYYRSYAATINEHNWCKPLVYLAKKITTFTPDPPFYWDFLHHRDLWRKNDGIVPLISQFHPQPCHESYCTHDKFLTSSLDPQKGRWYVIELENCSHIDIIPGYWNQEVQSKLFQDYLDYLVQIE